MSTNLNYAFLLGIESGSAKLYTLCSSHFLRAPSHTQNRTPESFFAVGFAQHFVGCSAIRPPLTSPNLSSSKCFELFALALVIGL